MNGIIIAWFVGLLLGGVLGFYGRSYITKEKSASKTQLTTWAQRLRIAVMNEAESAKTKVEAIVTEIEKKL